MNEDDLKQTHYSEIKDSKLLRLPEVSAIVNFGKTKIYKMMDEGTFPKGVCDGRYRRWPKDEIIAFRILYWGTNEKMPPINNQTREKLEQYVKKRNELINYAKQ